jgi:hypothetical protein
MQLFAAKAAAVFAVISVPDGQKSGNPAGID